MCYNSPGPRCANHTRTQFRQTKEALIVANANFEAAKENLSDADDLQAQAKLMDSEKMLKLAQANHDDASEKYEASKADRAEKMDAYRDARDAYLETAEGIQGLRDAGKTDEAEKYATIRAMKMEELKRVEAAKAEVANGAIKAVIEKPVDRFAAPPVSAERYAELAKMAEDRSGVITRCGAYRAASAKDCPADILEKLASDNLVDIREQVAENRNTPASVLRKLSTDSEDIVRGVVARHKNTDSATLNGLARDEDGYIRASVASHRNALPSTLASLVDDEKSMVRTSVARNPNLPVAAMNKIKNDSDESVVKSLAMNTAAPSGIQKELSDRNVYGISHALALNSKADGQVLSEIYSGGFHQNLAETIIANEAAPEALVSKFVATYGGSSGQGAAQQAAAKRTRISPSNLEALSKTKDFKTALNVVMNAGTPKHVLQGFVDNASKGTRNADLAEYATQALAKRG